MLEITGPADGLLDDPLVLRVRAGGPDETYAWRARMRDDDGRAWRSVAPRAEELSLRWAPSATESPSLIPALGSLRPVAFDVRAEAAGGGAATRTIKRRLAADGVRRRRWRDGLSATLHLPAGDAPVAVVLLDATGGDEAAVAAAPLTASLLASRGVLALVVAALPGKAAPPAGDQLALAAGRLAAVPAAGGAPVRTLAAVPPPPGIGVRGEARAAAARAAAWDALLAGLAARPRAS